MSKRRQHDPNFKAKVAIEAIKNDMTLSEICNKHSIGPTQVKNWKTELLDQAATVFTKEGKTSVVKDNSELLSILERKIGQLTIENDFLKKNLLKFPGKID